MRLERVLGVETERRISRGPEIGGSYNSWFQWQIDVMWAAFLSFLQRVFQ